MKIATCLVLTALAGALCITTAQAAPSGYHLIKTVTLGGDGGWDYLNLDPASGDLFITRGNHLMVVDPVSGKQLADITGLEAIHGGA